MARRRSQRRMKLVAGLKKEKSDDEACGRSQREEEEGFLHLSPVVMIKGY